MNLGLSILETTKVAARMSRWDKSISKAMNTIDHRAFVEAVPAANRRKMKQKAKLNGLDHLDIAYKVLVEHHYQSEVAKEYRISASRVSSIVKSISKDGTIIAQMRQKHMQEAN